MSWSIEMKLEMAMLCRFADEDKSAKDEEWVMGSDKCATRWIQTLRFRITALLKLHHAVPREMNEKHAAVGKR
jgi:hypothetical protein